MNYLKKDIFELLSQSGVSSKHAKMLLLLALLLIAKFIIIPIVEWQSSVTEEIDFYNMQYRSETKLTESTNVLNDFSRQLDEQLILSKKNFYKGKVTTNQVAMNDLLSDKVGNLDLSLVRQNSRLIHETEQYKIVQYSFTARGYAKELQELVYWVDTINPKLIIKNVRFSSSRGSSVAEVTLIFQQYLISDELIS